MSTISSYSSQPSLRKKQTLQDCEKNKKKKRLKAKPRDKCSFCMKLENEKGFTMLINKALFSKYASSQNFYYMKDINEYLQGIPSSNTIKIKDYQTYDREQQKLKRFYYRKQYSKKIDDLTQYFKFYKEVPRIFMNPISKIMAQYNQKKRAEEYKRIKIILSLEDQDQLKIQDKFVNIEILKGIDLSEELMRPSRRTHEIDSSFTMYELKMKLNQIIKEEPSSKRQIYDFLNSRAEIENCSFDCSSINQISIIKGKEQETVRNFDSEKKKEIDSFKFYKRKSNPSPNISMNIHKLQLKPKLQKKIIKEKTKKQQKEILSKRISQEHLTFEKKTRNVKKKKEDKKKNDVFSTETSVEKNKLSGLAKIKGSMESTNWHTKQKSSKNIEDNMKAIISLQNLKSKLTFTFNDYKIEGINANKLVDDKEKKCKHVRTNSDQFSKCKQKIKVEKNRCKHKYTFSECLGSKITINQNNFVNIILKKEQDKKLQLSRQKWKKKEKK